MSIYILLIPLGLITASLQTDRGVVIILDTDGIEELICGIYHPHDSQKELLG